MIGKTTRRAAAALAAACLALALAGVALATPSQPRRSAAALSSLEQGVLADINAFRVQHKLAPLRLSSPLTTAAREHSQQMAVQGYFAHESADGSAFWKRIQRFYPSGSSGYWSVGENLLWSSPDVGPARALDLWMHSPEHRANILSPHWREIGLSAVHFASAPGTYRGSQVTIITTDFGARD
jgi:uncharacterized protein YkwD